jgi:hypothetical protein
VVSLKEVIDFRLEHRIGGMHCSTYFSYVYNSYSSYTIVAVLQKIVVAQSHTSTRPVLERTITKKFN